MHRNLSAQALYGDIENFARAQGTALPETPGSVLERRNAGGYKFYAHQYYEATGRKVEKYIASLVGSHAYGALLNQLGVRAAQYATKDVDIARNAQLAFEAAPQLSFLEMLKTSGIAFFEVPNLNKRKPGTSFKEAGSSFFQVDLLVPSATDAIVTARVPELKAHATALPYLRYLLGDTQEITILAREGCCMVRVPTPERFALHKLIVSQLRKGGGKTIKDVDQACVLFAVLADRHPGALADAAKAVPLSGRKYVAKAAVLARQNLASHPRAIEALDAIL